MTWRSRSEGLGPPGNEEIYEHHGSVVYPTAIDLPDIFHDKPPTRRVNAPEDDCALCQVGLCVQALTDEGDVIVHGRWTDA